MQHAPFKLTATATDSNNTSQANHPGYQNSVFDTPPSLNNTTQLSRLSGSPVATTQNKIDMIRCMEADATFFEKFRNLGRLESGPSALTSEIVGDSLQSIMVDRYTTIILQLRDASGVNVAFPGYSQFLFVKLLQPDGLPLDIGISEQAVGVITIAFVPKVEGFHLLHIQIHGVNIKGSPMQFDVRRGRNYKEIAEHEELLHFGNEGHRMMQHAFKLNSANTDSAIGSQASLSGYQNSIFDSPPSLYNTPQLNLLNSSPVARTPNELDIIRYWGADASFLEKIRSFARLESVPSALTSEIVGDSLQRIMLDRYSSVVLQLRDASGVKAPFPGNSQFLFVKLIQPDGSTLDVAMSYLISDEAIGVITIAFVPKLEGLHSLHIQIHGMNIKGSPMQFDVRRGRNYKEIAEHGELFHFGKEGSGDGEFCRPWGICCDHKGRIIVADRSNNRIQIFDCEGKFLHKFGFGGNKPGQFDRPAGVCVNSDDQIIVADKDNHRVQVFDDEGNYIFKFGERGRGQGMFNYPWGVASNSLNEIAVSDTRNHRVQVFSQDGQFLLKCGFDTAYFYKHLDSPRGVCYMNTGQLLITDFNNHRVVMIGSKGGSDMKCYGSEGEKEGLFLRPQGITTDMEGHILVCDSRNNRIQVFASDDMCCISVFGCAKALPSPGSVCTPKKEGAKTPSISTSMLSQTFNKILDFALPSPTNQVKGALPFATATRIPESSETSHFFLDRPTDLCIGHDGRIYVVDFGNSCIRVF